MSVEDNELDISEEQAASSARKGMGWLAKSMIALVVLGAGGGAGWYFFLAPGGEDTEATTVAEAEHGEPLYFTLADNLVVNFKSATGTRYLQVGIDLMTYDKEALEALKQHSPVIRSNLILLLSDQSQDELMTREGKEKLRDEALAEVRAVMTELHGSPVVEALYFTTFVMQ